MSLAVSLLVDEETLLLFVDEEAFLQNRYLRLRALFYSMDVKDTWEGLAMHGRGLWDGARVYYTCEASTQGKEGSSFK